MLDWTGDTNNVMKTLGASNHSDTVREQHDYYATDPKMVNLPERVLLHTRGSFGEKGTMDLHI